MRNIPVIDPKTFLGPKHVSLFVEEIENRIDKYTKKLSKEETLDIVVILNDGSRIFPTLFSDSGQDLVIIEGFDSSKQEVYLLVHQSDVQILITRTKVTSGKKPQEIEFEYHQ